MPRGLFEWAVVATAIAVVVANVGAYVTRHGGGAPEQHVLEAAKKVSQPPAASVWEPQPPPPPPASVFEPPSKARAATFAFVAARGDSWLSVHAGSFRGHVMYQGLLREGEKVRLRGRRLWVRFGGASDFDLFVNGRRAKLPLFGTYDAFVTPGRVIPDPTLHSGPNQAP